MTQRKVLQLVRDSSDRGSRDIYLPAEDRSDMEDLRSKAQAHLLEADKDFLKEMTRKPYWSSARGDELKTLNAAKSDLGINP